MGVDLAAGERPSEPAARCPSGGACGPFRAALKTYRKFAHQPGTRHRAATARPVRGHTLTVVRSTEARRVVGHYGRSMSLVAWVYDVAERELSNTLPRRWAHVRGVALKARSCAPVAGSDADLLEAAAILHDVGYAPGLAVCGFHPLDGARYLQGLAAPERLVHLVAHHSCAIREAKLRGLDAELDVFRDEEGAVRDALWHSDLTTTPDGEPADIRSRIGEIKQRYGPGNLVTTFITVAEPDLLAASARTESRLATARTSHPM